jgi:hypothetical protein
VIPISIELEGLLIFDTFKGSAGFGDLSRSKIYVHNNLGDKMAKKKVIKRKKAAVKSVKLDKGIGVEFHSWTFFLFLLFVLVVTLVLVAQQVGFRFF